MNPPPSKLETLAGLIRTDGKDPKPGLLRVLTDFYVQKRQHSPEEDRHFTELALRLIEEVDAGTRADFARRLSEHGGAPAIVMQRLAGSAGDRETDLQICAPQRNTTAPPESRSAPSPELRAGELRVTDQDRAAAARFTRLFFAAGPAERRAILRELETGAHVTPLGIVPNAAASTRWELEGAALRGRPFEFVRQMERTLAIPRSVAEAVVNDVSGEPLLVVAKAVGMTVDAVQRILLLINPAIGNSVRRVFDLSSLYGELSLNASLRLISLWRYSDTAAPAPDAPAYPLASTDRERRTASKPLGEATSEPRFEFGNRNQRAS